MSVSQSDFESQAKMMRDRLENGLEMVGEYGRPLVKRYGRTTAVVAAIVAVTAIGVAVVVARRHRRRPLSVRLHEALPDSVTSRLEKPLASIKIAADRLSR